MVRVSGMAMAKKMIAKLMSEKQNPRGRFADVQNVSELVHHGRVQKAVLLLLFRLGCLAGGRILGGARCLRLPGRSRLLRPALHAAP